MWLAAGPAEGHEPGFGGGGDVGQVEIGQQNMPCVVEQDVLWFQIPIDEAQQMQLLQRQQYLRRCSQA